MRTPAPVKGKISDMLNENGANAVHDAQILWRHQAMDNSDIMNPTSTMLDYQIELATKNGS